MEELDRLNRSTLFRRYMSEEEDQRKIYNSKMSAARKEGLKEGIEKGSIEEKERISQILLNNNVDIDIIASSTGLTKEEIEKLK